MTIFLHIILSLKALVVSMYIEVDVVFKTVYLDRAFLTTGSSCF